MLARFTVPQAKSPLPLVLYLWTGLTAGCNQDPDGLGKTAPVRGRVLVGDIPLHNGIVPFQLDAAKGNYSPHQPSAAITESGTYELFTGGKA